MNVIRALLALVIAALALAESAAFAEVPVPPLTARVIDETGTLTGQQRSSLEHFEARKGSQISVLIVPTTQPETIEQYSIRVAEQWKLGRQKVDDGALLIVAKNDRALRIEVGYGLEGVLTDATSNRIIYETIVSKFKRGDFYGRIAAGVDSIIRVVSGEPLPAPHRRGESIGMGGLLPALFVMAVVAGGVLRAILGRLPGAVVTGGIIGVLAWLLSGAIVLAIVAGTVRLCSRLSEAVWVHSRADATSGVVQEDWAAARTAISSEVVDSAAVAPREGGDCGPQTYHQASRDDALAGQISFSATDAGGHRGSH
ncbi:MAG: Beta-propeller domains of methanol dehydrogenase type [uncultured Paraburkholderia sp.]|nr:MAG: Beta-propeller domains of methanol dehydrogenase type [uncultured Paraburkholderia sp.]CAH2928030.1 MAG: Beta-propeller domains of methanol dehydrogenase type [uncultured Paraburkholderia sp.]CAH2929778.1 MAG: Beta-propeller domains of methanol dehydrogenase type [uncultured Paraburkholderia sp.]